MVTLTTEVASWRERRWCGRRRYPIGYRDKTRMTETGPPCQPPACALSGTLRLKWRDCTWVDLHTGTPVRLYWGKKTAGLALGLLPVQTYRDVLTGVRSPMRRVGEWFGRVNSWNASGASPGRACCACRSTARMRSAPPERPGGPNRPQDNAPWAWTQSADQ